MLQNRLNWVNVVFFSSVLAITLVGVPWYVLKVGVHLADILLFFGFFTVTGLSITVGYHRLLAHRAFEANPLVTFLSLFFGAAAFEQSALMWASQHRDHHRFVDTENDPYNIRKGFWHAHMGWMLRTRRAPDYQNVRDLLANPFILHQHKYYGLWAAVSGIVLPLAIGAAAGHLLGAFILGVAARLTLVHHSTFSVNSVCHTFGRATYDIDASARDHWLVAFLTNGEGYHNFHHRFASDYRNGVRWYHWDPSKWTIFLLNRVGLARKLYRVSASAILRARTAAEQVRVERALAFRRHRDIPAVLVNLRAHYEKLKNALLEWERCEKDYLVMCDRMMHTSRVRLLAMKRRLRSKRQALWNARLQWQQFINTHPLIPQAVQI